MTTGQTASVPEPCSCDESLALREQLKQAAAHIGLLLLSLTGEDLSVRYRTFGSRDAARAWLADYTKRGAP